MAKTKRRSCKGGRKSHRCRGGTKTKYPYLTRFRAPFGARPNEVGFSGNAGVSRLGYDTKQDPRQNQMQNLPLKEIVARQLAAAGDEIVFAMKPLKRRASALIASARGLKDSVLELPSNIRNSRLGAAAFNTFGLRSGYINHSQLVPVDETIQRNYGSDDRNASDKLYACDENGYLYEAALDHLNPDGYLPVRSNPLTAMFLPGREPRPDQSWSIIYKRR